MKRRDFLTASAGLFGTMMPGISRAQTRPCPPPTFGVSGGTAANTLCSVADAQADWVARSTGPGVVWSERFNDPNTWHRWVFAGAGDYTTTNIVRDPSDGIMGDGCLHLPTAPGGVSYGGFARPFKPVTGDINRAGLPTDGTTISTSAQARNHYVNGRGGSFGHTSYHNDPRWPANSFIGTDFYIQYRVKFGANRFLSGEPNGKISMFVVYAYTPLQELVQMVRADYGGRWFAQYTSVGSSFNSFLDPSQNNNTGQSLQPGGAYNNTCLVGIGDNAGNPAYCWIWPTEEWVTVLTHFIPGQQYVATPVSNPANDPIRNTGIEVWVAPQSRINAGLGYLKIWDFKNYVWMYSDEVYGDGSGVKQPYGFSWLALNSFTGGAVQAPSVRGYYHKYDQIVFSNQFIPCPTV